MNTVSDEKSLWRRVYEDLLAKIRSGTCPAGSKLPSEYELCSTYSISRITVRRALRELELEGLISRRRGAGTEVTRPQVDLSSRLIHLVMSPHGHVLSDIHTALMAKLGEMRFSHRIWTPDMLGKLDDWAAIATVPARGMIVIPWDIPSAKPGVLASFERTIVIQPQASLQQVPSSIGIDYLPPIRALLDSAVAAGYRAVIHITFHHASEHRNVIAQHVTAGCIERGLRLSVHPAFDAWTEAEQAEVQAVIAESGRPALVLCATDFIASSVCKLIRRMGISIPGEMAVSGIYDTPWSQAGDMTTIGIRPQQLAELAIGRLVADSFDASSVSIPGELILRSTGPVPAS